MTKKFWMGEAASVVYSFLAGAAIAVGGILFLSIENRVVGALFFTLGLFAVCTRSLHLFTGKIGYLPEELSKKNFLFLISISVIWLGNFAGTAAVGYAMRLTRVAEGLIVRANAMVELKLADNLGSIFILALFCGVLMYLAVDGFRKNDHVLGKYLGLFLCVAGFILAGFEHCVANMFYFSVADAWTPIAFGYLLIMTLGNAVGSFILPIGMTLFKKLKKE